MTTSIIAAALIMVESAGNVSAINQKEQAYGCLQIRQCVLDDVNRKYLTLWKLEDMLDRNNSIAVFNLYMQMYATKERLGREPTEQDMARIWQGGPNGWKKSSTVAYWQKTCSFLYPQPASYNKSLI